jgi:formate C-acetyltransferase
MRDLAPSPFGSVLMQGCVERGRPLEAGAARYNFVGINILGLGTIVDSLRAVRELVYERGELTLTALAQQVAADFPDERLRQRLLHLPGRYGTDHPETNALAAELSATIARLVLASRLDGGPGVELRPYPGFFAFSADIYACQRASPDGRRQGEVISYGAGPATSTASSPTAVLHSAAHVAHDHCACGNPVAISLSRHDVDEARGGERLRALLTGYFAQGGMHVHFNLMDAAALRQAQALPQEYADLTVRVSGYSARFAQVERRWQDALIARAEHGL